MQYGFWNSRTYSLEIVQEGVSLRKGYIMGSKLRMALTSIVILLSFIMGGGLYVSYG